MKVRVQLIGTGVKDDEFRAPLPTYAMLDVDYAGKTCVVEIPDTEHPFDAPALAAAIKTTTPVGQALSALTAPQRTAWHQHLDKRYVEHAGQFRPVPQ